MGKQTHFGQQTLKLRDSGTKRIGKNHEPLCKRNAIDFFGQKIFFQFHPAKTHTVFAVVPLEVSSLERAFSHAY